LKKKISATKLLHLRALADNPANSGGAPGRDLLAVSAGVVTGSAVDITVVAVALDLGSVVVQEGKAVATTGEDLIGSFRKAQ
jgi:hypothetical protein